MKVLLLFLFLTSCTLDFSKNSAVVTEIKRMPESESAGICEIRVNNIGTFRSMTFYDSCKCFTVGDTIQIRIK